MPPSGPITWSGLEDGERSVSERLCCWFFLLFIDPPTQNMLGGANKLQTRVPPPLIAGAVGVLGSGAHPCQGPGQRPAGVHVLHGTTGAEGFSGSWT